MNARSRIALAAGFCLALSGAAFGQAPAPVNPVMQHYRAYQAALERDDLVVAEAEASAAFDASVARDGDGGSTGTLALNLAQVRLQLNRPADAYGPALRASAIAGAGNARVDPFLARLLLGRAELTDARAAQGQKDLQAAIDAAKTRPELDADTYDAAAGLGRWLFQHDQYAPAIGVWEVARDKADAAGAADLVRADARMNHAAALFVSAMAGATALQTRPMGTRIDLNAEHDAENAFNAADIELVEVQNIAGPSTFVSAPDGGLTVGQHTFATATAWRALVRAFASARFLHALPDRSPSYAAPGSDSRPYCHLGVVAEPKPVFPSGAQAFIAVGAVVVRFTVDENGHVTDNRIAATIPERWFRDAVERVAPQWRMERLPDSAPDCRSDRVTFVSVQFTFR